MTVHLHVHPSYLPLLSTGSGSKKKEQTNESFLD